MISNNLVDTANMFLQGICIYLFLSNIIFSMPSINSLQIDESSSSSNESDAAEWCMCGHCINMPTLRERICCTEIEACEVRMDDAFTQYNKEEHFSCITRHPGFINNCLLWEVLDNVYGFFQQYVGRHAHAGNETKRRRYTAYCQLARFL